MSGKLYPHLIDIDEQAHQLLDIMIPKLMAQQGVTEELNATKQMKWVGRMNIINLQVEEIFLSEIVYK